MTFINVARSIVHEQSSKHYLIPIRAAFADREKNRKSLVSGGGDGDGGGSGGSSSYSRCGGEIYHRPKPYPDPEPDPDTGSRPIPHHCYDKESWI